MKWDEPWSRDDLPGKGGKLVVGETQQNLRGISGERGVETALEGPLALS